MLHFHLYETVLALYKCLLTYLHKRRFPHTLCGHAERCSMFSVIAILWVVMQ